MGNRSLVIHFYNGTRLACANWVAVANATNLTAVLTTPNGTAGSASTSCTTATSSPATSSTMASPTTSDAEAAHAAILKNVIGLTPMLAVLAFAVA